MNTIKNLIGTGQLLIISLIFASCGSDYEECPFYDVVVSNNYFEPLDSVCFNNTSIIDVEITKQHTFNNVPHGKQTIRFYTKSKLEISAEIDLLGDIERVYVELTESGRICLEKNDSMFETVLTNNVISLLKMFIMGRKIFVPENADNAVLYVFSLNGNMLLSKPITQTGSGSITISGSELKPGMYIYTLAVNGVEADSKRMILTDK